MPAEGEAPPDRGPGVGIPPPAGVLAGLIAAQLLNLVLPLRLGPPAVPLAVLVALFALVWIGWALIVLVKAGNDPRPDRPDTALVERGPYRLSRNPIYSGFVLFLTAVALYDGMLWSWLAVGAVFLWLDFAVVRKEEAYLVRRFGPAYEAYQRRVRRWL
ncbi:MAG: isoprenylcysteine carboxylmethyltransferase family protein [Rhodovarius sp.]|nr:isoprenylcysteine carboxylmethyltransferase family protein [Rhodovarius sp.]